MTFITYNFTIFETIDLKIQGTGFIPKNKIMNTDKLPSINEVGATAFIIASIRAMESEKKKPLFNDPYAVWFSNERARKAAKQMDAIFTPSTTMVRFRTRYFDQLVKRSIDDGVKQVVLLGGGFDMRAHRFSNPSVSFFEIDQAAVLKYKRSILKKYGVSQPASVFGNYLEVDLLKELNKVGFNPNVSTLILWEGNTMYLPYPSIMPFLSTLTEAIPSFRIAFDYFAVDLQRRELMKPEDMKRIEGIETALGASLNSGFPDLAVFDKKMPFRIRESGSFFRLAEKYGELKEVDNYPQGWRETLALYNYCLLMRN